MTRSDVLKCYATMCVRCTKLQHVCVYFYATMCGQPIDKGGHLYEMFWGVSHSEGAATMGGLVSLPLPI